MFTDIAAHTKRLQIPYETWATFRNGFNVIDSKLFDTRPAREMPGFAN
jgi:hypothetical protein